MKSIFCCHTKILQITDKADKAGQLYRWCEVIMNEVHVFSFLYLLNSQKGLLQGSSLKQPLQQM